MGPRKPKVDDDATSTTSTDVPSILKPKNEKAKVEKPKAAPRPRAPKKEKENFSNEGGAEPAKEKIKAVKKEKEKEKGEDGEGKNGGSRGVDSKGVKGGKGDAGKTDGKDGKEKVKPVTGEEAMELIASYLKMQNRPYSATDVSLNLHGKVTKTVADKLLKEMEQNGQIKGKASKSGTGGQWVFWPLQDPADAASPEELVAMENSITCLRDLLPTLKGAFKSQTTKLNTLIAAPTTIDLAATVDRIRQENQAKSEKLRDFKEGTIKTVTKEEVEKVEKDLKYWGTKRILRKKAFENLESLLMDGMSREDIWEKAGIEDDVY